MSLSLRHLLALVSLLAVPSMSLAQGALVTLAVPSAPVPASRPLRVEIVLLNPSSGTQTFYLGTAVTGRLDNGRESFAITLQSGTGEVRVPAGGFSRIALVGSIPAKADGRYVLEITQPAVARAVVDITPPDTPNSATTSSTVVDAVPSNGIDVLPALPAANRLRRYYADHFSAHEPMYFIMGAQKPAARFQLSLKYRLLNDTGPLATNFPALKGLHVAYTQRSLWDITAASSPFYDTTYSPEVMFESLAPDTGRTGGFTWLGYQTAFQHESNGRDGADSRSFNTVYFRPGFAFGDLNGWRLIVRPKFFTYLGSLRENSNIKDYRGYGELRVIFGRNEGIGLSLTGRIGEKLKNGSLQFDVAYPTEYLTGNFAMYLHAQYWTGYGESLLNYDRRTSKFRAGLSLAR
jgi:outer membrane phospholipase A